MANEPCYAMKKPEIEKHVEQGMALVDTRTSLFVKAIYHDEQDNVKVVLCNSPCQAHIFSNARYLEDFIAESERDSVLRRRNWLRVPVSRSTQVIGSISHLYELNNQ